MSALKRTMTEASCPICRHVFTYQTVTRPDGDGGQDADFCPKSLDPDLLSSYIVLCPNCLFAVYQKDFHAPLAADELEKLRRLLLPRGERKMPMTGATKYLQAVSCYEQMNRKTYFLATVHLRGSWWCRSSNDRSGERNFQQSAVELLERALREDAHVGSDEVPVITYLIGELNRRLGHHREASEWFEQVPDLVADSNEQKWLIELTEQQKELNANTIN